MRKIKEIPYIIWSLLAMIIVVGILIGVSYGLDGVSNIIETGITAIGFGKNDEKIIQERIVKQYQQDSIKIIELTDQLDQLIEKQYWCKKYLDTKNTKKHDPPFILP